MQTKKANNRLIFVVVTAAVFIGVYWSAHENEIQLANDEVEYSDESKKNETLLSFMKGSFQQTDSADETRIVEATEIGEPLSLDFFPEKQAGVPDVNIGRVMDVNDLSQDNDPLVQIGSIMSVESLPTDTGNTVAINLGEMLNADDYYGKGTPVGGSVNKGKPMDADEYLKQQSESPSEG